MTLPTLYTADDLREHIGNPTDLPTAEGYVSQAALEKIALEGRTMLIDGALAAVRTQGLDGLTVTLGEQVPLELRPSGHSTRLAVADIPVGTFPYAFEVSDPEGRGITYRKDLELFAASDWTGRGRGYCVRGRELYVYPASLEAVSAQFASEEEVVRQVQSERVPEVNQMMVQKAARLMDRTTREQARQANYEEPED